MSAVAASTGCVVCKKSDAVIDSTLSAAPFRYIVCTACAGDLPKHVSEYHACMTSVREKTGLAELAFELDFGAIVSAVDASYRLKLGQFVVHGYVREITDTVSSFVVADEYHKAAFARSCHAHRLVYRFGPDSSVPTDPNISRYQPLWFEGGKLIVQSTPQRFRTNANEISVRALDSTFDREIETTGSGGGSGGGPAPTRSSIDPKDNFSLPLRVRKDFRDAEKHRKTHLETISKALNGQPIVFECDVMAVWSAVKPDARMKLGTTLYDGYLKDVASVLTNFCSGSAGTRNREAFITSCYKQIITYRTGTNRTGLNCDARYQQMFFESGSLVIQSTPANFRINTNDLTSRNLEFAFDDQITAPTAAPSTAGAVDVKSDVKSFRVCLKCGTAAARVCKFCDNCGAPYSVTTPAPVPVLVSLIAPPSVDGFSDPKSNRSLPLRTRNDFAKAEPRYAACLESMQRAMGVPIAIECDYVKLFHSAPDGFRWNLGSNTYDGIFRSISEMIVDACSSTGGAALKEAFLNSVSTKAICFRFGSDLPSSKLHTKSKYQHIFLENGKLIVQSKPTDFRANSFELERSALTAALL